LSLLAAEAFQLPSDGISGEGLGDLREAMQPGTAHNQKPPFRSAWPVRQGTYVLGIRSGAAINGFCGMAEAAKSFALPLNAERPDELQKVLTRFCASLPCRAMP